MLRYSWRDGAEHNLFSAVKLSMVSLPFFVCSSGFGKGSEFSPRNSSSVAGLALKAENKEMFQCVSFDKTETRASDLAYALSSISVPLASSRKWWNNIYSWPYSESFCRYYHFRWRQETVETSFFNELPQTAGGLCRVAYSIWHAAAKRDDEGSRLKTSCNVCGLRKHTSCAEPGVYWKRGEMGS